MQTGLDRVAAGDHHGLAGKALALVCNHTTLAADGRHGVEVLGALPGTRLLRLLGPEHGIWGTHQDMETVGGAGALDPVFGLPVHSLYGAEVGTLRPAPELLADLDGLVYDIQDVGARYYTYVATLALCMEVARDAGIPVWVLDRPNPIGAAREGPLLRAGFESFCGLQAGLPIRHGLTAGELAAWYARERVGECDLRVVACDRDAEPPWVAPSPNMPTRETAFVYPGACLLEGTTISEGRGTTTPFLLFGAPGVEPLALVRELRRVGLSGADFVPRFFRPAFSKHAGEICGGAGIRILDRAAIEAVPLGVHVLAALKRAAPERFAWRRDAYEFVTDVPAIDLLWGGPELREVIDAGADPGAVEALCELSRQEGEAWKP